MDVYRTDEEQVEALKRWWAENGKSILAGIVIGLAAIYGWRMWQDHLHARAEAASADYQHMMEAVAKNETDAARKQAQKILDDYPSSSYARFAELMLARIAVDTRDYAGAEGLLRKAMDKASNDQIRHIARLRLARLLIAEDKLKEAEALLTISDRGKFLAQYEELRGDIFLRQGMTEAAQNAYKLALANTNATEQERSILQMKVDELGGK